MSIIAYLLVWFSTTTSIPIKAKPISFLTAFTILSSRFGSKGVDFGDGSSSSKTVKLEVESDLDTSLVQKKIVSLSEIMT